MTKGITTATAFCAPSMYGVRYVSSIFSISALASSQVSLFFLAHSIWLLA